MPIKKAASEPSQREIDNVIKQGSPPVPAESKQEQKELNFPMRISGEVAEAFEKSRSKVSLSRRSWVMLAIVEKLERDGNL